MTFTLVVNNSDSKQLLQGLIKPNLSFLILIYLYGEFIRE